jgi:hypothetical protein
VRTFCGDAPRSHLLAPAPHSLAPRSHLLAPAPHPLAAPPVCTHPTLVALGPSLPSPGRRGHLLAPRSHLLARASHPLAPWVHLLTPRPRPLAPRSHLLDRASTSPDGPVGPPRPSFPSPGRRVHLLAPRSHPLARASHSLAPRVHLPAPPSHLRSRPAMSWTRLFRSSGNFRRPHGQTDPANATWQRDIAASHSHIGNRRRAPRPPAVSAGPRLHQRPHASHAEARSSPRSSCPRPAWTTYFTGQAFWVSADASVAASWRVTSAS